MLAALPRPLFNADSAEQARELVGEALERLRKPLPKVAALLEEAQEDLSLVLGLSDRPPHPGLSSQRSSRVTPRLGT
jgi:hypothetical protein